LIPIYFKGLYTNAPADVIAADIGGTKVNMALCHVGDDGLQIINSQHYHSLQYTSFIDIIQDFLKNNPGAKPERMCVGVAGPVLNQEVELTNLSWKFSAKEICDTIGIKHCALINDLEATAYGLACIDDKDFYSLNKIANEHGGNAAIFAPGTGLGEAGLFWSADGNCYHPFATEGGHCSFGARTELDHRLMYYLQQKVKVVSWEHVASGMGIANIYGFLRDVEQMEEPQWLKEELSTGDHAAVVSKAAIEEKARICVKTMELFITYFAHACADLVMKMKATGGLFLGGGIPPKIMPLLQKDLFFNEFINCDRMQDLVQSVPIYVVMNDKAALRGAAMYAAKGIV
jgi:glucokinase